MLLLSFQLPGRNKNKWKMIICHLWTIKHRLYTDSAVQDSSRGCCGLVFFYKITFFPPSQALWYRSFYFSWLYLSIKPACYLLICLIFLAVIYFSPSSECKIKKKRKEKLKLLAIQIFTFGRKKGYLCSSFSLMIFTYFWHVSVIVQ